MQDDLRELYQEVILDHGRHPRNLGNPPAANRHAHGHNPMCGDSVVVHVTVDDAGVIRDAAFEGKGCAISVASASLMTEVLKGKTEAEARALFDRFHGLCTKGGETGAADGPDLERLSVLYGVREFPMRVKCATLAWHTLNAALTGADDVTTE